MSEQNPIDQDAIQHLLEEALSALERVESLEQFRAVRSGYLGQDSLLSQMNGTIKTLPGDQKAAAGKLVGQAKGRLAQAFETRGNDLERKEQQARLEAERVDVTTFQSSRLAGGRHPVSLLQEHIADVFVGMGWEIAEGPECESEWYNFDALNFDADHPARAMQDTFFIDPPQSHLVLRTHTSPVQLRALLNEELPLYRLAPGRVFRTDEFDATHLPVFHQTEGIAVDKGLSMAHLKGTLELYAKALFGADAWVRLRPSYFPFTEPSAELDLWHPTFAGGPRWIEWGGCGMIHPNVLRSAGIDPEEYSGFAFGMGVERTMMFRNNVAHMRDIAEGDVRFSQQFGMVI